MTPGAPPPPDPVAAAERVARARTALTAAGPAAAVLSDEETVRHLTALPAQRWPVALVIGPEESVLVRFAGDTPTGADRQIVLDPFPPDGPIPLADALRRAVAPLVAALPGPVAIERSTAPGWLTAMVDGDADATPLMLRLRRRKDADQIAACRYNAALIGAGFAHIAGYIEPGRSELEVFHELHGTVERLAGEPVPWIGDFASGPGGGLRGGPPTRRVLEPGDAYVIDYQLGAGGAWADLCRTFCAGPMPARLQEAIAVADRALDAALPLLVPGTRVRDVDRAVRAVVDEHPDLAGAPYPHLTGHGIGVVSHEPPWIGAGDDSTLVAGDVIALEPGLYADVLRGGVRIEDNFAIAAAGPAERLSDFPRTVAHAGR